MKPIRSWILASASIAILASAVVISRPIETPITAADTLQAGGNLKWYRGNMHTHSLWSDGDDFLEMTGLWYRDHAYDFLVYTDHNTLANKERWVDINKNEKIQEAYKKLKAKFPKDWIEERIREEEIPKPETAPPKTEPRKDVDKTKPKEMIKVKRNEVRLHKFSEVSEKLNVPGKFLQIQGEEITDKFGKSPVHMNAHNLRELIPPLGGASVTEVMQNNVNAVMAQRERTKQPMFVHLNHPNFGYGVTAEDLAPVRGENFFEVYNGHPGVNNQGDATHTSCERIWDIVNTKRIVELNLPLLYGLATDDGHNYHNIPSRASEPGRGWVMVLAKELSPAALIDAMEAGRFYASSGVMLEKVEATQKGLSITLAADDNVTYSVDFIGSRKGVSTKGEPIKSDKGKPLAVTQKYSPELGAVFKTVSDLKSGGSTTASYEFKGDELYVRARVTSSRKHPNPSTVGEPEYAWTQPIRP